MGCGQPDQELRLPGGNVRGELPRVEAAVHQYQHRLIKQVQQLAGLGELADPYSDLRERRSGKFSLYRNLVAPHWLPRSEFALVRSVARTRTRRSHEGPGQRPDRRTVAK
jgi:hypothetical protein